jgi:hypothetical protein
MPTITLKTAELKDRELPYGNYDAELDKDCFYHTEVTDTSRWSVHYDLIFEYKGKFYKTHYSKGATEYQDERPWEYEDEVECVEVNQVEKMVKVWEEVK